MFISVTKGKDTIYYEFHKVIEINEVVYVF